MTNRNSQLPRIPNSNSERKALEGNSEPDPVHNDEFDMMK